MYCIFSKVATCNFCKKELHQRSFALSSARFLQQLFSRTLVNGCISLNKLANSLCSLIYASGNRPRFRKRFSEFKVNESPNKQCRVTSHYSTGKNLLKKILRKNICKKMDNMTGFSSFQLRHGWYELISGCFQVVPCFSKYEKIFQNCNKPVAIFEQSFITFRY